MRATIVYESEFGATRAVAEAIGSGMSVGADVTVTNVHDVHRAGGWQRQDCDLLVIGIPTHARTLPTSASRAAGATWPARERSKLRLEPDATTPGVREWLAAAELDGVPVAVFATRMDMPRLLTGSAVRRLKRAAKRAGGEPSGQSAEFAVTDGGVPGDGELARAEAWGRELADDPTDRAFAGRS